MKLISNKISKQSGGSSSQDSSSETDARPAPSESFEFQYKPVGGPGQPGGTSDVTQAHQEPTYREQEGDAQGGGDDDSELTFVFNELPSQSVVPQLSSGALLPLSPTEILSDSSSGGSTRGTTGFHHEVTWQMLHLLATKVGKFKAANGSIMSVSLIGVEEGLGDIIQVEMVHPEIDGTHYVAVVLANDKKVEVLAAQQTLLVDVTAYQEVRQFVTTGSDVAQAIWEVQEMELRRMGQKAVDAFQQMGQLPVPSW